MLQPGAQPRSTGPESNKTSRLPEPEGLSELQQQLQTELETIESIIESRIKDQERLVDKTDQEAVSKLKDNLRRIEDLKNSIKERGINRQTLEDAQNSISGIPEAKAIADLRETARQAMENRQDESHLERFKEQASAIIQGLPGHDIREKEATHIVDEIVASEVKDLKLGFFQRFLIRVQLLLDPKKGVEWLKAQIQKNPEFKNDNLKTLEYIKENYPTIAEGDISKFKVLLEQAKNKARKEGDEEAQKLRARTAKGSKPQTEAKAQGAPPPESTKLEVQNGPLPPPPQSTRTPESILQAMGAKGKEARASQEEEKAVKGIEMMKDFMSSLKEGERSSTPSSRITLMRRRIIKDISDNIQYSEDQIDQMFEHFVQIGTVDAMDMDKAKNELEIAKASVKDIVRSRTAQRETMSRWYSEIESSVQHNPELKTEDEKQEALAKQFTKRFIDTILEDHAAILGQLPDDSNRVKNQNIFYQAIESGQIILEFYDGVPVLKVNNPPKGVEATQIEGPQQTYSSGELMALLNGEDLSLVKLRSETPGKSKTPLGLFINPTHNKNIDGGTAPNMIAVDVGSIKGENPRHLDQILDHEIRHIKMLGFKEEQKTFLINRQVASITSAKWANKLIEEHSTTESFKAEINALREKDPISARADYLESLLEDPAAMRNEVHTQLASFIKSEYIAPTSTDKGNEFFNKFAENNTAQKFQEFNRDDKLSELEEFVTNSIDSSLPLTLGDLGFDSPSSFNIEKPEHQTLLGMMRLVNMAKGGEETTDINKRSNLEAYRIQIADYFGSAFKGLNPNLGEFKAIITSALNDEQHPLHGALKALNGKNLSPEDFLEILLDQKISEKEFVFDNYVGGYYKATNNRSDLRHTATHQKDAYYFGSSGFEHRMGGGQFGAKQDVFSPVAWFHQKDKGPGLFQLIHPILGSKKFYMDGLGIGQNRFHIDSNDGLEAISFATGIPFHRMPFLRNFAEWLKVKTNKKIDLDKKEWLPKGIFTAEPSTYLYYTLNVIYGKLQRDHRLDNMALIKLLPEMGGFDYDAQGQPVQKITSYATRADQYRLNDQLADFIEREIIYKNFDKKEKRTERVAKRDKDGRVEYKFKDGERIKAELATKSRDDLERIVKRLRSDEMVVNGIKQKVFFKEGQIVTDKLYDESIKTKKTIRQILLEDKEGRFKGCKVQDGRLRLGQITQSTVDEIKEMMFIPENHKPKKARNPWGMDAIYEERNLTDAEGNLKKIKSYEKIADYIMKEDDRRFREEGTHYTITELYEEMCRAQNEPWPDLYKKDEKGRGIENKEAEQRYQNPTMLIAGDVVKLNDVKEFIKDFSMARANKVLSVGVWGQEADYDKEDETDYRGINKLKDLSDDQIEEDIRYQVEKEGLPYKVGTPEFTKYVEDAKKQRDLAKGLKMLESQPDLPEGTFGTYWYTEDEKGIRTYYFEEKEVQYGQHVPVTKSFRKVKSLDMLYSADSKLKILSKQSNFTLEVDPIKNFDRESLIRYFGEPNEHEVYVRDGKEVVKKKVYSRSGYSTQYYGLYDDVVDEFEKIKQGRQLSYKYSLKLHQIGAYRERAKISKEMWDGFLTVDRSTRFLILGGVLLGSMVPGLAFLANPTLLLGTLGSALTLNPLLARYQKGWAARELQAIQMQNEVMQQSSLFWGLTNENEPPSFGALELATSQFEGLKFSHLSILKNFGDAEWDSNTFTNIFKQVWGKVAERPF